MRRLPLILVSAVSLAHLAGCGWSPPSTFYALGPTQAAAAAQTVGLRTVLVRRPWIAGYLDRPEIVLRQQDYRLGIAGTDRWAEPLDAMIGRVLSQDLGERLRGISVFTSDGSITADPDATVEVDVDRFDVGDQGDVTLVAQVAVERGTEHAAAGARSIRLHEVPRDASTGALVATMSSLLGQLADRISVTLHGA